MSRQRRERAAGWKCLKCGAKMHLYVSDRIRAHAAAAAPDGGIEVVEVCGGCGAWHKRRGDALALLSDAEIFAIRMAVPQAAELTDKVATPEFFQVFGGAGAFVSQDYDKDGSPLVQE